MFKQGYDSEQSTRIYTRKELVMMETTIPNFHTSFNIPSVYRLEFYLQHIQILGTNNCCDSRRTSFKRRESFQDMPYLHDYAKRAVTVEIDPCILSVFNCNILVHYHRH